MFVKRVKSIQEIHDAYQNGEMTPEGLVKERKKCYETVNPFINAVVQWNDKSEAEWRQMHKSSNMDMKKLPLYGIPVTIKDNIAVKGLRATAGHLPLKDNVSKKDAVVVERLKNAGAIILGKTNLPELAMDAQTDNLIYGQTNNPYNIDYCAGGSSGGSAASVVAGIANIDIGNDLLGSIRIPASYCGAFSLTPTEHIIPHQGIVPELKLGSILARFFRIGILANRIEDLSVTLQTIMGYSREEPSIPPIHFEQRNDAPRKILFIQPKGIRIDSEVMNKIDLFMNDLKENGIQVEEKGIEELRFDDLNKIFNRILMTMIGSSIPKAIRILLRYIKNIKSLDMNLKSYIECEHQRLDISATYEKLFSEYDLMILPATPTTAFQHSKPEKRRNGMPIYKKGILINEEEVPYDKATTALTIPLSVVGNPVVTIPIAFSERGLPISVQIVARKWNDRNLIKMAGDLYRYTEHYQKDC